MKLRPFLLLGTLLGGVAVAVSACAEAETESRPDDAGTVDAPTDVDAGTSLRGVIGMSAGAYHTCAIVGEVLDNEVRCWGGNVCNQISVGAEQSFLAPQAVGGGLTNVMMVGGGSCHSCSIDNMNYLQCWGQNTSGQLGNPDAPSPSEPIDVFESESPPEILRVGAYFNCVKYVDGTVKCWGSNDSGQINKDPKINTMYTTPQNVSGLTNVRALCAGESHACAVVGEAGNVKCWGNNSMGQLGDGTTTSKHQTTQVFTAGSGSPPLKEVTDIVCGPRHTCALMQSGGVKCWGANDYGQLGLGDSDAGKATRATRPQDTIVPNRDGKVTSLCAGGVGVTDEESISRGFTCAIMEGGTVKCWGDNQFGQLGAAAVDEASSTPVDIIDAENVSQIVCGGTHVCALMGVTDPKTMRCWGGNQFGQLGTGDKVNAMVPQDIQGL